MIVECAAQKILYKEFLIQFAYIIYSTRIECNSFLNKKKLKNFFILGWSIQKTNSVFFFNSIKDLKEELNFLVSKMILFIRIYVLNN